MEVAQKLRESDVNYYDPTVILHPVAYERFGQKIFETTSIDNLLPHSQFRYKIQASSVDNK